MVNISPIKVLLADPHRVFVELMAERLDQVRGLEVVGTATTAREVLARAAVTRPQVVLTEMHFDDWGGLDTADELLGRNEDLRIVFLTGYLSEVFVEQAARLSAGYLLKTESLDAVIAAIRMAAAGETPQSAAVARQVRLLDERKRLSVSRGDSSLGLTPRQIEMLRHYARGLSVREVAGEFGLSEKGAESQKSKIMEKLGLRNRVELARYAIREGLVTP